ncbi:MAG: MBOAT family O-acyltransferase [Christensenellales bacterium]
MVFSSTEFLFVFLPCVLLVYYLLRGHRARNTFLTIASLLFYAWGEPWFVLVMLFSIACNWLCGRRIGDAPDPKAKKRALTWGLVFNLLLLGVFKYLMFVMRNINWAFGLHLPVPNVVLPIGISFFTFQAISYIIDVYRGNGKAQKSFMNVCLYIAFFPQLIAGPIVRYETIALEIDSRREILDDFSLGARRFMVGLSKKAIMANSLALLADSAFAVETGSLSVASAWLGAIAYLWQVYFDFSGYSDMAIGLGCMFGFHFLENFDFPMLARSITEFWRRWHISLGTWFRDYLFFPLGGSRVKSKARLLFNMFVVWSLTGLWHGADWTFLLWGVLFWLFLVLERMTGLGKALAKSPWGNLYAMGVVTVITVLIRSSSIAAAGNFIGAMFGIGANGFFDETAMMYLREYGVITALALIVALPVGQFLQKLLHIPDPLMRILRMLGLIAAFAVALSFIVMGSYNPFIYFNF